MTSISSLWTTLDTTVQQWLLQNPGTMVLPRTYVNRIEAGAGQVLNLDEHGEYWLSPEDMLFLKATRSESPYSMRSPSPRLHPHAAAPNFGYPALDPHDKALDQ
ncbi:hypothetical protein CVO76_16115 [Arthrobacter agilis]|uniref:Uncharacterized protein n=1 Tax=Arthrobacter agilis TaxID=37921 RepID=A0A2L0UIH6_9MICC|nr:hypothetical protein [Arthrobacter agilis]AUZ88998.1 hypothetical protein CVO76_16115 [Arthrobacter agilis]